MKITNKLNLPQPIVDAVRNDAYTKGDADISVTTLCDSPRIAILAAKHSNDLTEDASDRIWSLLGQSIHAILERANANGVAERRLSIEVEGLKISGGMDLYESNGVLSDYKVTNVGTAQRKIKDGDYDQQLNVYAQILRQNGIPVKKIQIVAILRDWYKTRSNPLNLINYPASAVLTQELNLWTEEEARIFIRERVLLHKQARVSLPECTPDERWAAPTEYAVMKKGGKRSVKNYSTRTEAEFHAVSDPAFFVQERPGGDRRCESYCSVAQFCTQYQSSKQPNEDDVA